MKTRISFFILILLCLSLVSCGEKEQSSSKSKTDKSDFKASCQVFSYDELLNNDQSLVGTNVKCTGKVISFSDEADGIVYFINITKDSFGDWYDTVCIKTSDSSPDESLVSEEITVYGVLEGIQSYSLVMGIPSDVPCINAEVLETN